VGVDGGALGDAGLDGGKRKRVVHEVGEPPPRVPLRVAGERVQLNVRDPERLQVLAPAADERPGDAAAAGRRHDVEPMGGAKHVRLTEGPLGDLAAQEAHELARLLVDGDVQLTGNGADLAEEFGVAGELHAEPGTVVVLVGDDRVRVSDEPYDHRVAGIVSGAGSYRPAIVLHREPGADRCALALTGKVWCKVDADAAPVDVGDLLTTSNTPGHAMRARYGPGRDRSA